MRINGMRRNSPLTVIFCLFLLVSWNTFAGAQLTKLKVGYSAISEVDLPAWVAKETRIFEKNGLDVQLIYFTGGTTNGPGPVSRGGSISHGARAAVVDRALAGCAVVIGGG